MAENKRFAVRESDDGVADGEKLWFLEQRCAQGGATKLQLVFDVDKVTGARVPRCNGLLGDPFVNLIMEDLEENGRCVGSISAAVNNVHLGGCAIRVAWLCQMRVLSEYRRRGLARQLIAAIELWMTEHGVSLSFIGVKSDNVVSSALFQRCGYHLAYDVSFKAVAVSHSPFPRHLAALKRYDGEFCHEKVIDLFGHLEFFPTEPKSFDFSLYELAEDGFTVSAVWWHHTTCVQFTEVGRVDSVLLSVARFLRRMLPNSFEQPPEVNQVIKSGQLYPFDVRYSHRSDGSVEEGDFNAAALIVSKFVDGVAFDVKERIWSNDEVLYFILPVDKTLSNVDGRLLKDVHSSKMIPNVQMKISAKAIGDEAPYRQQFENAGVLFFNGALL